MNARPSHLLDPALFDFAGAAEPMKLQRAAPMKMQRHSLKALKIKGL